MGFLHLNTTCPLPKDEQSLNIVAEPIVGSLTFQQLALYISLGCTGVALILSLWLAFKHLRRWTEPMQQRQIIRIIFTPVVFSIFSALSLASYNASIYLIPMRDLYETFALASLFLLWIEYVAPDPETRDQYFDKLENRKRKSWKQLPWNKAYKVVPGGCLRWFQKKYAAIFLYCFAMIVTTIAEEITQATGTYCATSFSPVFANIWILVIQNVAISVAITGLLNFYVRLSSEPEFSLIHKPLPKLISFKLIVFINFVQDIAFDLLTSENIITGNSSLTGKDYSIGIPALLVSVEQVGFAIFFHYSFRSREYDVAQKGPYAKRFGMLKAATMAFNMFDLCKGMYKAFVLLFSGVNPYSIHCCGRRRHREKYMPGAERVGMEPLRYPGSGRDDYGGYEHSAGFRNSGEGHQHVLPGQETQMYGQQQYLIDRVPGQQIPRPSHEALYQPHPGDSPPSYASEPGELRPEPGRGRSSSSGLSINTRDAHSPLRVV